MNDKVTDHEEIWLEPSCDKCKGERTWCQDNVYEPCPECGREATQYVAYAGVTELFEKAKGASH